MGKRDGIIYLGLFTDDQSMERSSLRKPTSMPSLVTLADLTAPGKRAAHQRQRMCLVFRSRSNMQSQLPFENLLHL